MRNEDLGSARVYFINWIINRMEAGAGRAVIETVTDGPVLETEAKAILKGQGAEQYRPLISVEERAVLTQGAVR